MKDRLRRFRTLRAEPRARTREVWIEEPSAFMRLAGSGMKKGPEGPLSLLEEIRCVCLFLLERGGGGQLLRGPIGCTGSRQANDDRRCAEDLWIGRDPGVFIDPGVIV